MKERSRYRILEGWTVQFMFPWHGLRAQIDHANMIETALIDYERRSAPEAGVVPVSSIIGRFIDPSDRRCLDLKRDTTKKR